MNCYELIERLKKIDQLILRKATGSPKELAKKLGISERAWYKLRDQLINDLDLPIKYCHYRRSYFYTEEGEFIIGFKRIDKKKSQQINGGYSRNWMNTSIISQGITLSL